jgi:hypothetical protein
MIGYIGDSKGKLKKSIFFFKNFKKPVKTLIKFLTFLKISKKPVKTLTDFLKIFKKNPSKP